MKICVYAIAKNEEKFVERWVSSMREADGIYVLDTGSTDRTVGKLADLGVVGDLTVIVPKLTQAIKDYKASQVV